LVDLAFKNLFQRKTRSLLTLVGIGTSLMLYLYSSVITNWYEKDMQTQLSHMAGKVIVKVKSEDPSLYASSSIPEKEAEQLLHLPEVDPSHSTPILLEPIVMNAAPGMPPSVQAVGLLPGREMAYLGPAQVQGTAQLGSPNEVILGSKAAAHYNKGVGDQLELRGHPFKVVGVMQPIHELLNGAIVMPLSTAQEVFTRTGIISVVYLTAKRTDLVERLAADVKDRNPKLDAMTAAGMNRSAEEMLVGMRSFFGMIKRATIATAIVVIMIVMHMAVSERKREIGTMKAIGGSASAIVGIVLVEALVLSLAGGVLAIPITWAIYAGEEQKLDLATAAWALLTACLVGVGASLLPAWSSVRVTPLESLRHE
jgi:putative ABC transport system permease protein